MLNKLVVLLVAAGMSMTLCAMPTAEEQEKVRPLVQGLMKPDLDAMKQGKKSRSDVAKSAMDLYSKADSPAAKMLLARNALNLYAKAGEYEAAESALDALLAAVPDYPAADIAELLEKTLHPIPLRAAPNLRARLAAVKDKAQAASQLKKLLPVYGTLAEGPKRKACAARIASAYVALDDWPNANKYFAVSDSPAAAAASAELKLQDEPEASRPYDKPADAWWLVELPKKDAKLSAAIRSHAAALYAKSLPSLKGLAKVQAERRIAEVESTAVKEADVSADAKKELAVTKQGGNEWVHCEGGSVYLDTGIIPKSTMTIEWDVRFAPTFQGNKNFSGANASGTGLGINTDVKSADAMEIYFDKWHNTGNDGGLPMDSTQRNLIQWTPKGIFVNNVLVKKVPIGNCSSSLVIFDRNRNGKPGGNSAICWVYGVRIKDGSRVLLDLKPKEEKGVCGFWDSAKRRFVAPSAGELKIGRD